MPGEDSDVIGCGMIAHTCEIMQEHARKSRFLASQPAAGNAAVVPNFNSKSAL